MAAQTLYANVVVVKISDEEIVLEFGVNFPSPEEPNGAKRVEPDVRIVMPRKILGSLVEILQKAEPDPKTVLGSGKKE